ncbi:histidine kinase [Nonomuraea roseoviolacea subsp. roseoviolacea]|uniref:histidine kinase n=1 Tax=Nonomuraea roseoviolacea subsp. carminata TaxID=160689 RepID=A0ABT1KDY0_9ACTN|nr:histidine kinase [Nonomuraea roseoviolacea]MCP2351819.1 signal transduction histidine kinase [Nonomuraea roseoviolacea subsp. carminata]
MTNAGHASAVPMTWAARFSGRRADGAIAAATTAATLGPLLASGPKAWWIIALGVLASAPVHWRRRAPMAVALFVGVAMTVMVFWEKPFLPFGPLVAVYTVADLSPTWKRLAAIPAIAATVGVSLALPGEDGETFRLIGTAFVAAYALGTSARANRSRAAELAERARRREQEHIAAVAEERARIARDMHDIITHSIGLMVVQAEAGPVVVRSDAPRAEAVFDAIADTGRGALTELRGLLTALRASAAPVTEDLGPVQPRLDGLAALAGRSGLDVVMTVEGEPRPTPGSIEAAVYRIVQEALTNVRKHAGVRAVRLRLRWTSAELLVEVADEGRGPRPGSGGHGLIGMRERAAACGGTLSAGPGQEHGFMVRAVFPLE